MEEEEDVDQGEKESEEGGKEATKAGEGEEERMASPKPSRTVCGAE